MTGSAHPDNDVAISLMNCTFGYNSQRNVLRDFAFELRSGRTVLLGPNGAGKSTLLSILATAVRPRRGELRMNGASLGGAASVRRYRRNVAWLPQATNVFPGLTVREHVAYTGWLKGLSRAEAWSRSAKALDAVNLVSSEEKKATELSGGQARRMAIAGAVVHDAQVLLLDEPTAGLDPSQRKQFAEILGGLGASKAVLVSTHQTDDIEDTFDQVVLLDRGEVRFEGAVQDFAGLGGRGDTFHDRVANSYLTLVRTEE